MPLDETAIRANCEVYTETFAQPKKTNEWDEFEHLLRVSRTFAMTSKSENLRHEGFLFSYLRRPELSRERWHPILSLMWILVLVALRKEWSAFLVSDEEDMLIERITWLCTAAARRPNCKRIVTPTQPECWVKCRVKRSLPVVWFLTSRWQCQRCNVHQNSESTTIHCEGLESGFRFIGA